MAGTVLTRLPADPAVCLCYNLYRRCYLGVEQVLGGDFGLKGGKKKKNTIKICIFSILYKNSVLINLLPPSFAGNPSSPHHSVPPGQIRGIALAPSPLLLGGERNPKEGAPKMTV